jgi:TATA-box binding protein (TBP) (component of TFIID and TFIIIB)
MKNNDIKTKKMNMSLMTKKNNKVVSNSKSRTAKNGKSRLDKSKLIADKSKLTADKSKLTADKSKLIADKSKITEDKSKSRANNAPKIIFPDGFFENDKVDKDKLYFEQKKYLNDNNISISTITMNCKLHTNIFVDRLAKYAYDNLSVDGIVSVKYGDRNNPATNKSIIATKSKKKASKKTFYNQTTILIYPSNSLNNPINIKVFINGSLHLTGVKNMEDFSSVTNKLIDILKMKNDKPFVETPNELGIFDVKIRMINSGFKINFEIDRKKFASILYLYHGKKTKDTTIGHVDCKYNPKSGHSCVNIKYDYNNGKASPSIFVFKTGSIIITGAKILDHIVMAHKFICNVLNKYYEKIKIIDLESEKVIRIIDNYRKTHEKNICNELN